MRLYWLGALPVVFDWFFLRCTSSSIRRATYFTSFPCSASQAVPHSRTIAVFKQSRLVPPPFASCFDPSACPLTFQIPPPDGKQRASISRVSGRPSRSCLCVYFPFCLLPAAYSRSRIANEPESEGIAGERSVSTMILAPAAMEDAQANPPRHSTAQNHTHVQPIPLCADLGDGMSVDLVLGCVLSFPDRVAVDFAECPSCACTFPLLDHIGCRTRGVVFSPVQIDSLLF